MGRPKQTPEEAEKSRQKRRDYKTNHQKARRANQRLASAPTPKGRNKERVSVEAIQAEIAVNGAKPVSGRFIREPGGAQVVREDLVEEKRQAKCFLG